MTIEVINRIRGIENYSYLELGVNDNQNYNSILCKNKMSVDLNGQGIFKGSTDDFFKFISNSNIKFDIIFIDANHDYDYALRDYNNSVLHTNKWIIMHDTIPPEKQYVISNRCSDSYKILYYLMKSGFTVYPMTDIWGTAFIKMPAQQIYPDHVTTNLIYEDFVDYMSDKRRYNEDEIGVILQEK